MMRAVILLIPFAVDVVLKVLVRISPDALGRFSFSTSVGTIGLAPSVNDVLAFSLPVPNQYIWPVGWLVVFWLIWTLIRDQHSQSPNPKHQIPNKSQAPNDKRFGFGNLNLFGIWNLEFGISHQQTMIIAIVLGAIPNLVDRTFFGGVTDYLSFTNLFPAFNIADLLIIGGIIGWIRGAKNR